MSERSELLAENIYLKNKVQELNIEIQQWKSHIEELSMKYYKLQQHKINPEDLLELEDLKLQQQRYQEQEFQQSVMINQQKQVILNLQSENRDLIDKVDKLEQKAKNYDCLKQQYWNLEKASQKYFEELETIKQRPPTILVPNPDVTALYREINRLNAIIQSMCKNSIESMCVTSVDHRRNQPEEQMMMRNSAEYQKQRLNDQSNRKSNGMEQFY
ncbi:unnamed protein product (macronuclear) [Paramecium tetraurelia]|uniref:Uncharacterized protein n=1 Tax=Paramecium tetraurelia TaxID=5888 RepID=A0BLS7_PARTE|nr:uncharacterized protein GSPATT00030128001 [Paramecium tetraurelia]CAK59494.1 unnamed protein product [Paramecium tetraurelia]|eukprot:XP_001426892.1 hypothetical protein (macronuclear) [Paramecium tetraurelia strain d4-2]